METQTLKIKEIPTNQQYWFFRTEAGSYYPDFYFGSVTTNG